MTFGEHLRVRVDGELRSHWRSLGHWTDEALGWMLEQAARAWPGRPAVTTSEAVVTFAELQRTSSAVARTLLNAGVRRGDPVCWMLSSGSDAIAVASAIWRIGAVSSPIVPIYGARELTAVVDQVRPKAVITEAEVRGRFLPDELDTAFSAAQYFPAARLLIGGSCAGWTAATASGAGALPDGVRPAQGDEPGLILFTSGTEALPKAAVHSIAGLGHEVRSCASHWGVTFRDRMFMASPITHITGLLQGFLIPARTGAGAVLMDRWDAVEAVELIESTGATYMAGATPFLRELDAAYRRSGMERSSLRQYCCGGASVPSDLIRGVEDLGISAYRAWGMTELPTSTLAGELDPIEVRADTDGRLAPGVELRVLDGDGVELPIGELGTLQLRGPEMMLGYLDPVADSRAFRDGGWFDTGDIGSLDSEGCVRVSGRTKDIINRGGEKFSAKEIEDVIVRHPDVTAAAVVAVPGGRLGERVGVVVVGRSDLAVADLSEHVIDAGMAKQKRPELVLVVDRIPTNATGKVDKKAVRSLLEDSQMP